MKKRTWYWLEKRRPTTADLLQGRSGMPLIGVDKSFFLHFSDAPTLAKKLTIDGGGTLIAGRIGGQCPVYAKPDPD